MVTHDDVVDVLEAEATEDIYRLAQVSEDAEIFSPIPARGTQPACHGFIPIWGQHCSLPLWLRCLKAPLRAWHCSPHSCPSWPRKGATQATRTMTIMVRSLALGEIDFGDAWRALWHELRLGALHGLLLGGTIGVLAWLWVGNPILGVIISTAMIANLIISALVGVLVPLTLKRIGVDPALASGVFVTATTDVMGFAIFLSLATYFLAWLV